MARTRKGVEINCEGCGIAFYIPAGRIGTARFCSYKCAGASHRVERKNIICETCGVEFDAYVKPGGKLPRFCSRKCYGDDPIELKIKECPSCGDLFQSRRDYERKSADGLQTYCSVKCAKSPIKNRKKRVCINCGKVFSISAWAANIRSDGSTCSESCRKEFHKAEHSATWKGGKFIRDETGAVQIYHPREGYISRYIYEHRLIAEKILKRRLKRTEIVIHINNNKADNRPENLFVCHSSSESAKRHAGSLPWPSKSNLNDYGKIGG